MRFNTCNIVLAVIVGIAIVSGDASEEHIIADYVVPEASPSRTQAMPSSDLVQGVVLEKMQEDPANIISLTDTAVESSFVEASGKDLWRAALRGGRRARRARRSRSRRNRQSDRAAAKERAEMRERARELKEQLEEAKEEAKKFKEQWTNADPPLISHAFRDIENPYVARALTDISARVGTDMAEQLNKLRTNWAFFGLYPPCVKCKTPGCSDKCESVLSCDGECKWPFTDPEGKMLEWPESVQERYQQVLIKMDGIKQLLRQEPPVLKWPQPVLKWTPVHPLRSVEDLPSAEDVVLLQEEILQAIGKGNSTIADEKKKPEYEAYYAKEQDFKYHMEKHEKIRNSDFDPRGDSYIHSLRATPRPTPTSSPLPDLSSRKYWSSSPPPPPPPPPPAYAHGGKGRI